MKSHRIVAGLALLALAPVARGQSSRPPATPESRSAGREWTASLPEFDRTLCRTYRFVEQWSGAKQVGATELEVTPAPAGSGAVYRAVLSRSLKLGFLRTTSREEVLLDRTLARVQVSEAIDRSGQRQTTELRRAAGRWVYRARTPEGQGRRDLAADAPDHAGLVVAFLLARKLGQTPGPLALQGVSWPAAESLVLGDSFQPARTEVTLHATPLAPFAHGGKQVPCRRVCVSDGESYGEGWVFMVDARGEVLAFWGDGEPTRAYAGAAPAEEPDAAACRALVELWIDVTCGARGTDALDGVVDWAALQRADPQAAPDLDAFRAAVKGGLAPSKATSPELTAHYKGFVVIERDAGGAPRAELFGSFGATGFTFVQHAGRWRIASMPRRAPW